MPGGRALSIHLRERPGALLLEAARIAGQAVGRIHGRGHPTRVSDREVVRAIVYRIVRATDFIFRFLSRSADHQQYSSGSRRRVGPDRRQRIACRGAGGRKLKLFPQILIPLPRWNKLRSRGRCEITLLRPVLRTAFHGPRTLAGNRAGFPCWRGKRAGPAKVSSARGGRSRRSTIHISAPSTMSAPTTWSPSWWRAKPYAIGSNERLPWSTASRLRGRCWRHFAQRIAPALCIAT